MRIDEDWTRKELAIHDKLVDVLRDFLNKYEKYLNRSVFEEIVASATEYVAETYFYDDEDDENNEDLDESRRLRRGRMLREDNEDSKKKYKVVNEPPYESAKLLTTTDDYDEAIELIKKYAKEHGGCFKVIDAETGKMLANEWNKWTLWSITHDNS